MDDIELAKACALVKGCYKCPKNIKQECLQNKCWKEPITYDRACPAVYYGTIPAPYYNERKKVMAEYNIVIKNIGDIYINGVRQHFSHDMVKDNKEDDLKQKALLALANEMGYEATYLFDEMHWRLEEMLEEE